MKQKTLTTGEIAEFCDVNFRTVIRWIDRGLLKSYKLPGRGDNRVQPADFVAFLQENNMPIPDEFAELDRQNRILVIDDDEGMASAISRLLIRQGYEVEVAHSGFEAGSKLASFQPVLVTLDLSMPGIDGFDVLRTLRTQHDSAIKVIVISALNDMQLEKAIEQGADLTFRKPFDNDALITAVTQLIRA